MSKETNQLLGHADEADGIEEYDNPLPDWWLGLLWFTIIWAIIYGVNYHFIQHRSQVKDLAAEMAAADTRWPAQVAATETEEPFEITPETVAAGEVVFKQNCVPCHGADLKGGIGPSFLDDEWLHGGHAKEVIHTITEGVPAKGMVTWKGILSPEQIRHVAAFVLERNHEATGRPLSDILSEPPPASGDSAH